MKLAEPLMGAVLPTGMGWRFDPQAAGDLQATFRLEVSGDSYAVVVAGGRCRIERRPAPEASAWLSISAPDLIRLVSGSTQWTELLAQKRLEMGGDPFLALRFPKLFRVGAAR